MLIVVTLPESVTILKSWVNMKFEIGDKVVVLHSNEEGEVIDIINDKMVMVEIRGVKFPAYNDQLDFPYFKRFTEKKLFPSAGSSGEEKRRLKHISTRYHAKK